MTTKEKIIDLLDCMIDDFNHRWTSTSDKKNGIEVVADQIMTMFSYQDMNVEMSEIFLREIPYNIGNKVLSDEEREELSNNIMAVILNKYFKKDHQ